MKAVRVIVAIVTALMLAVTFIGAGYAVCTAPPVTHGLSWVFASDSVSPFDRNQLVRVADAARDYSFGDHDLLKLYQTIYDVDVEYRDSVGYSAASTTGSGFPKVDQVVDKTSVAQFQNAFNGASEQYCFSQLSIAHLDDCHLLAALATPLLVAALILTFAGLVFTGITGRKRRLGVVLTGCGILLVVAFLGLCAFAIVDFNAFFTAFHQVLFSQGNWTFPYDSLLICALPTPFWAGMGVIWTIVTLALAFVSILVGRKLARRKTGK